MTLPIYIQFARELRKSQTPAEKIVWEQLRARRLLGFKFLRQHPVLLPSISEKREFYIADFYCAEKKLVIEIDGSIHMLQGDYDEARDYLMNDMGLTVVRIKNKDVLNDIQKVIGMIEKYLK